MPAIGIIDDRKDIRETLRMSVNLELNAPWKTLDIHPLKSLEEYLSWITENEIAVMLLDERLHEQGLKGKNSVNYDGHDLVDYLRKRFKTLPIFVITAFSDDEDLQQRFGEVEGIISRQEFTEKAKVFVARFIRAGQKFVETFEAELQELSEKAQKIAQGKATKSDKQRAMAIREKMNMAFPLEEYTDRNEWLVKFENKLKELEKATSRASKYIKRKKS